MKRVGTVALLVATITVGRSAQAQQSTAAAPTPSIDFSGLMFGSYNVRTDSASRASLGGKAPNQFNIDRAYLTFRMPAGDNAQIRVTADIFQNTNTATNAFYQGWALRLKYAYFQYTGLRDAFGPGTSLLGRVGTVQNVIVDQAESFWPRFYQQGGVEHTGFFSSADLGVAGLLTLPNKWGEVYATIVNGPGYSSYEKDRFKDAAMRVSITPFAHSASASPLLKSAIIVPWYYKGYVGSAFASGGAGEIGSGTNGAITEGMPRDRYGLFVAVKEHRLTAGADIADRVDASEAGLNTIASPRVRTDSTARLVDGYVLFRPVEWIDAAKRSPVSVVARFDHLTPNVNPTSPNYAGTTPAYLFLLFGVSYDLTQRITVALDWQGQSREGFPAPTGTNVRATPEQSTYFFHWFATF